MTTPAPSGPTLSLTTDKDVYQPGDTITLTASYADSSVETTQLVINASASDQSGQTASASVEVSVAVTQSGSMEVQASDSFGDTFTEQSNDGTGTAVLTAVVGTPPAG